MGVSMSSTVISVKSTSSTFAEPCVGLAGHTLILVTSEKGTRSALGSIWTGPKEQRRAPSSALPLEAVLKHALTFRRYCPPEMLRSELRHP